MSIAVRHTRPCFRLFQRPTIKTGSAAGLLKLTQLHPNFSRNQSKNPPSTSHFSTTTPVMSFSNTDTGSKPADPYKEVNKTEPGLKEKVEDLVSFIESCKFGMMTTRIESSGLLVSRCMALAAKVSFAFPPQGLHVCMAHNLTTNLFPPPIRRAAASTSSSTPTPNPAKPTT